MNSHPSHSADRPADKPAAVSARTHWLPRGATLRDLEEAGQATIPVHHDTYANAADLLGIGRALAFRMAADGRLPVITIGRRRRVPVARLRALLDGTQVPVS